jgi:hypothetical protein
MYRIDDYDGAEEGVYGTEEEVRRKTHRFIETYKEFHLDNFNDWAEINKTIDCKIQELIALETKEQEESKQSPLKLTNNKWWKFW